MRENSVIRSRFRASEHVGFDGCRPYAERVIGEQQIADICPHVEHETGPIAQGQNRPIKTVGANVQSR